MLIKELIYNELLEKARNNQYKLTQASLAKELKCSTSTVNHALKDLKKNGAVEATPRLLKIRDPKKILYAVENLKKLIKPGGKVVVTLPLGYNQYMDELLKKGKLKFSKMYLMKRISKDNEWIEVKKIDKNDLNGRYGTPYMFANKIIIGIIEK